jgi:hypothetical protein
MLCCHFYCTGAAVQIRKIKFRTLGNASTTKQAGKSSDSAAADSDPASSAAAAGFGVAPWM